MHRAEHLHGVVAKITTWKDLFQSCREYEDVTAKTISVFVQLHGGTFNRFFYSQSLKQNNSNNLHKEVKSKPEM